MTGPGLQGHHTARLLARTLHGPPGTRPGSRGRRRLRLRGRGRSSASWAYRTAAMSLIRHAYVRTARRNCGIGTKLLGFLQSTTTKPLLVGTWAAAAWAIAFYEKRGYKVLPATEIASSGSTGTYPARWTLPSCSSTPAGHTRDLSPAAPRYSPAISRSGRVHHHARHVGRALFLRRLSRPLPAEPG